MSLVSYTAVSRAQRLYGEYLLRAHLDDAPGALEAARVAYQRVFEAASGGDAAAIREVDRVLSEADTLTALQETPLHLACMVPVAERAPLLYSRPWAEGELLTLLDQAGDDASFAATVVQMLALRQTPEAAEALRWLAITAGEPVRRFAAKGLGDMLIASLVALEGPRDDVADWLRVARARIAIAGQWVCDWAAQCEEAGVRMEQAMTSARELLGRVEGYELYEQLTRLFLGRVANLRTWNANVEHVCRRANDWLGDDANCRAHPDLADSLRYHRDQAIACARSWGQDFPASGFRGYLPNSLQPGLCDHCASWMRAGDRYCRQCGAFLT